MKIQRKAAMIISLLCYLAVSSAAVVHASADFKFQSDTTQHQSTDAMASDSMMPNCHQQVSQLTDQATVSLCNIFCSALGNLISNEFTLILAPLAPDSEVAFLERGLPIRELTVEPHPPK